MLFAKGRPILGRGEVCAPALLAYYPLDRKGRLPKQERDARKAKISQPKAAPGIQGGGDGLRSKEKSQPIVYCFS